jgi:hypothetical protein
MPKTKINFLNPFTKKREIGILTTDTGNVNGSSGGKFKISKLKKTNQDGGVGFFETFLKGKKIQNSGEYKS